MLVPLISVLMFYNAIGRNPIGLKIGIVNQEIDEYNNCSNFDVKRVGNDCIMNNISCLFLSTIPNDVGDKVIYPTLEKAFNDEEKGLIHAVIHFHSNFTKSVEYSLTNSNTIIDQHGQIRDSSARKINVFIENFIPHHRFYLHWRLQVAYDEYSKQLMRQCGYPEKLEILPLNIELPNHVDYEARGLKTMGASVMMLVLFYASAAISLSSLTTERRTGVWNRKLLSGCKMKEIVTAHILVQSILVAMLVVESYFLLYHVFEFNSDGRSVSIAIAVLCGQIGIVGMLFGMCLSCYCEAPMISACALVGTSVPLVFMSGEETK